MSTIRDDKDMLERGGRKAEPAGALSHTNSELANLHHAMLRELVPADLEKLAGLPRVQYVEAGDSASAWIHQGHGRPDLVCGGRLTNTRCCHSRCSSGRWIGQQELRVRVSVAREMRDGEMVDGHMDYHPGCYPVQFTTWKHMITTLGRGFDVPGEAPVDYAVRMLNTLIGGKFLGVSPLVSPEDLFGFAVHVTDMRNWMPSPSEAQEREQRARQERALCMSMRTQLAENGEDIGDSESELFGAGSMARALTMPNS